MPTEPELPWQQQFADAWFSRHPPQPVFLISGGRAHGRFEADASFLAYWLMVGCTVAKRGGSRGQPATLVVKTERGETTVFVCSSADTRDQLVERANEIVASYVRST